MSQPEEGRDQRGGAGPESGLEGLRQSPEFRGPGDPTDDQDHANDHLALLYEHSEEQLAAAIPFIRQGLERGEQCLYVADDNSRGAILDAMRAHDIDVDAALESGALSVLTPADTYRRTGEFDRDTMLEFWRDSLDRAKDEEGYTGLRAAAEMTWALDGDTGSDALVEYEAVLNSLYEGEDYVVMCQYNREQFPAEVIHDVIKTHPYLVVDNTISENFYYTPPETFFGSEDPESKVTRMTRTLREHTAAKTELREHREYLRELYEVTACRDRTFEEKLQAIFELGCDRFDLELGGMATVDPAADRFEVEITSGEHEYLVPGERYPLSETYCQAAVSAGGTGVITDPASDEFEGKLCHEKFGVRAYLGTYLEFEETADRTFWFVSTEPRTDEFSDAERTFHRLMGQWVQYELERRRREAELEETIEQLQQSNDRLKQFAYAASHDLQEPLRMVSSYMQLLEKRYKDELDEEAREYVDFAVDGADRMRAMVDDLLAFARVEQADGEFERVDCNGVLDQVTDDLQVQIEENDAEITAEPLPTVRADSDQLEQVFSNLVSNAIKYSGDEPPVVEIAVEERASQWEFAVADNGIGIDPDKTDRIFEVFKRLHHDGEYPGTGIGLSLCQEIVENHGGDIWVDSEPGAGSTFFFTIPKQAAD